MSQVSKINTTKPKVPETSGSEISTENPSKITKELESADEHIQLAVELIYLLESNGISANTVLKALDIVKTDFEKKLTN